MATVSILQLKNWFKKGLKPTESQFGDMFDSFFHKNEKVPIASVDGLPTELNKYREKTVDIEIAEVAGLEDALANAGGASITADQLQIINTVPLVCSDEKTDLTTSTTEPKIRFVFQTSQSFTKIVGELNTAAVGGTFTVVAKKNGISFMSTNLTFDSGENTTRTASIPFVFVTPTVSFAVGDYVEVFVTLVGSVTPGRGLKIYLM
jgi:hypothetical protein